MDKRIIKTKRDIRNAFMELRRSYPVDKIRVSALCETALINKSTFYKYYEDIFALAAETDQKILNDIMDDFEEIGTLFTNPSVFLSGMEKAVGRHAEEINIVYRGRISDLVSGIEDKLKAYYQTDPADPDKDILISFLIGGATHAMIDPNLDHDLVNQTLNRYLTDFIQLQKDEMVR
jgi:AcrR family transcriptional regulator